MLQTLQTQKQPEPQTQQTSEIQQQIHHHWQWLEDRLTAPNHVLPGLSRNSTATTVSSDSSPPRSNHTEKNHVYLQYGPTPAAAAASSSSVTSTTAAGVEVTLDSAQQMQRVQQLEQLLEQTRTQHEQDRKEWVQTLQQAATAAMVHTKGGEPPVIPTTTLPSQQPIIESSALQQQQQKQKKQYKEKIRVLTELLELTEQQHASEKTQWKHQQQELEDTVAQLIADKSQLLEAVEKATHDIRNYQTVASEWKEKARQYQTEISTLQTQLETNQQEFESAKQQSEQLKNQVAVLNTELEQSQQAHQLEIEQWKKEVAYLKEQAADCTEHAAANVTKQARKPNLSISIPPRYPETPITTTQAQPSSSSLFATTTTATVEQQQQQQELIVVYDEKLDRALAERDMYQQEAELLQKRLAEETKKHASKVKDMLNRTPSKDELERAESDIMTKYREAVEKHGDLINRLKKIEDHRASDRGYFKLKLEAALAESRQLEQEKLTLERTIQELVDQHAQEIHQLELKLQQQACPPSDRVVEFFPSPMHNHNHTTVERHRPAPERGETKKNHPSSASCARPQCQEMARLLESTQAENQELINRCEEFSKQLEEVQTLHANASHKYERALADRNQFKGQLEALQQQQQLLKEQSKKQQQQQSTNKESSPKEQNENVVPLDLHHYSPLEFMKTFDELRGDVTGMRKALDELTQSERMNSANFKNFQGDLETIQNSLNDAVAELTLEADSFLESREMIKEVATSSKESQSTFTEQQSRILEELTSLRISVEKNLHRRIQTPQGSTGGNNNSSIPFELIEQLQEKEAALATAQADLRHCREKLESEIASRQKAEFEIFSLQEQADAYEEELMDLQSNNTKLLKQLHAAGLKIDAALLARRMPTGLDDDADDLGDQGVGGAQSTTPMLEDALKLAQGLTDIIHQRENADDEPSAMEMLERMSKMMDVHESNTSMRSPKSRAASGTKTPTSRDRHIFDSTGGVEIVHNTDESYVSNEFPPSPVETPLVPKAQEGTPKVTQLQLVVEQLYGRCELLERERVEMMEVTLDLLESAREANAAELEAALATARRKATEEIVRVRQHIRQEQENIFHRLCNKCIKNGPQLFNVGH
jgi:hypothetical protein